MRTVFVNPSRRVKRRRRSTPRRRRATRRRRRNAGITSFVSNPSLIQNPRRRRRRRNPMGVPKSLKQVAKSLMFITAGAGAGAGLNRIGISHIPNFTIRNLSRVAAATVLAAFGGGSEFTAAAAGATMAPLLPEIEMQLAAVTKNPQELAAELAGLLEADLSDDELEEDLEDDELEEDLEW